MKLTFYFHQTPYADQTEVYLVGEDKHGKRFLCEPMEMKFVEKSPHERMQPSLVFNGIQSREFFPALVDGLAKAGFKYESSDVGELKATKVHLDDMRKLVFKP